MQKYQGITNAAGEVHLAISGDRGGFNHGDINVAKETIIDHLCDLTQVQVNETDLALIDLFTQQRGGLIRGAP